VQVQRKLAFSLNAFEPADREVLVDLLHQCLAPRLDPGSREVEGAQLLNVLRVAGRHNFRKRPRKRDEILVLRHEVGLGVQLDQCPELCIRSHKSSNHPLGCNPARGLARLGAAPDAQQLLGLAKIAARLG
jgi:hypothetical protein